MFAALAIIERASFSVLGLSTAIFMVYFGRQGKGGGANYLLPWCCPGRVKREDVTCLSQPGARAKYGAIEASLLRGAK